MCFIHNLHALYALEVGRAGLLQSSTDPTLSWNNFLVHQCSTAIGWTDFADVPEVTNIILRIINSKPILIMFLTVLRHDCLCVFL
jgi:hypothetical protein